MINPVYKIQIDDLTIRCYEKEDALALKESVDVSLKHLHKYMDWSHHHNDETILDKTNRLQSWKQQFIENVDFTYAVFRGEKHVASTGLHTNFEDNALEIGYWVRADEINKGIATKISLALCIAAFEIIGVDRIEIHHELDNLASSKIPKKLLFRQGKNYVHPKRGEGNTWILDKKLFQKHKEHFSSFYNSIEFFDVNNMLQV